jgi:cell division control protein 6
MVSISKNYIEDLLKKPTLFKSEKTLSIDFIPERLPHREKELSLLSQLFISLISNPNSVSRKVLITGRTGIGKTATIKIFGNMLMQVAEKREIEIKYIHINCRKERTSYKILIKLVGNIQKNFPKRGYSPQDLLEIILESLEKKHLHVVLVLDELNYLIDKDKDIIYSLTRLYDDSFNQAQRISLIGIVRDISCLNNLDSSTLSTLQRNIIKFKKYSREEIYNILQYRIKLSLKDNVISNELIKELSEIIFNRGDIRYGLNILWKACKIAESKGLNYISNECLRLANETLVPYSIQDFLRYLGYSKTLFLLAIVISLKSSTKASISFSEVLGQYRIVCETYQEKQKSYSQLWNYLNEFKRDGFVSIGIKSKNIKGRKSSIKILDISLEKLENLIYKKLENKRFKL